MRSFSSGNLSSGNSAARSRISRSPGGSSSFTQRNFSGNSGLSAQRRGGSTVTRSLGSSGNFDRSKTGQGGSSQFSRGGQSSRDFVARNFNASRSDLSRLNLSGSSRGRDFAGSRDGGRGDFNRGSFDRGDFNRGSFDRGDFARRDGKGHGDFHHGHNIWRGYSHRSRSYGYYPWYNIWGLGYPFIGRGLGYGGWGGYGLGYGYPYYDNYATYGYSYPTTTYLYADATDVVAQAPLDQPATDAVVATGEFVGLGEEAFRAGQYQEALRHWQHAMVDDPNNGAVVLLMGQAMFALGQYEAAANTVQMAMQILPEAEWGNVVKNYTQLYGNIEDYTNQVRAAEKARDSQPDDGAIRFLLGYHFGYLNYPKQAVRELDKALDVEPRDVGSQKLRDLFAKQAGIAPRAPAAAQDPAAQPDPAGPAPPAANPPAPDAANPAGTDA